MNFQELTLADRQWVEELLSYSNFRGSEYTFSNNFNWKEVYGVQLTRYNDFVVIRCTKPLLTYLYPAGRGDVAVVIEAIVADAQAQGKQLCINGITTEGCAVLETLFPNRFAITPDRNTSDYIYTAASLETLEGKKLHGKRNHINKFKETNPDWSYEPLSAENLDECYQMNAKWCKLYGCKDNDGLAKERCAVESAFANFGALGLVGGLIRTAGIIVAYCIGRPLNSDTFIVHIEKAYHAIQGAYPIINQQFVEHNCKNYVYVNREEDTGDEGLRKAKLSYKPTILLEKFTATLKG